jgi:hypothetical protein
LFKCVHANDYLIQAVRIAFDQESIREMLNQSSASEILGGDVVASALAWNYRVPRSSLNRGARATSFKMDGVSVSVAIITPKTEHMLDLPQKKKWRHGNKNIGRRGEHYSEWQKHQGKEGGPMSIIVSSQRIS